jgi:putative ABC transport system permease protein
MEDHAKPLNEKQLGDEKPEGPREMTREEWLKMQGQKAKSAREQELAVDPDPLPVEQREVTAILLRVPPMIAPAVENGINEGSVGQAVLPVQVIYRLFESIVNPIQWTLLLLTAMICIVSGISILVSIYNSMSERRHEIAVIRALGAGRGTVMTIILLEATLLALGGGLLGWLIGHVGVFAISPLIEAQTGVQVGLFPWEPAVRVLTWFGITGAAAESFTMPVESVLLPALVFLAILVGLWPALSAYRTDVARSLGK